MTVIDDLKAAAEAVEAAGIALNKLSAHFPNVDDATLLQMARSFHEENAPSKPAVVKTVKAKHFVPSTDRVMKVANEVYRNKPFTTSEIAEVLNANGRVLQHTLRALVKKGQLGNKLDKNLGNIFFVAKPSKTTSATAN